MADISKITLPNGSTYDIKDATARNSINTLQNTVTSGVMYRGVTTTPLIDAATTSPISMGTTKEGSPVQYAPKTGDLVIYGDKEFIFAQVGDTSSWHEFGSTGSLKALAFKDNASASYTPAGSVSQPTFTGSEGSVSVSGSAYVLPKAELTIVDPNSINIPAHKEGDSYVQGAPIAKVAGADVALNTSSISQITDVGALPAWNAIVNGETLTIDWSAGKLPSRAGVTVATGVKSVTQPTVTIGVIDITFQSSTATVNSTGKFTPSGNVSKPTFEGTATTITVK